MSSFLDDIQEIEQKLDQAFQNCGSYPTIFLIGGTGSGKSTITASLLNKPLKIGLKNDDTIMLEGEGISQSTNSKTKISTPFSDHENQLVIIDNPGFFDTDGFEDEIKHAYGIHYLFTRGNNSGNLQFKIIFVIQDSEIDALRGISVKQDYERLEKMFGKSGISHNGVGIIITKARERRNYSKAIEDFADGVLKTYPIFLFKKPKRVNIGKQYEFEGREEFIEFLKSGHIVNPKTNISLSEEAISKLKNIRLTNNEEDLNNFKNIFKIMENELKPKLKYESKSESEPEDPIQSVFSILKKIQKSTFNKMDDLDKILNPPHFNKSLYSKCIEDVRKHEKFNEFIAKVLTDVDNKQTLNDEIQKWANIQMNNIKTKLETIRLSNNTEDLNNFNEISNIMTNQINLQINSQSEKSIDTIISFCKEIKAPSFNKLSELEKIINLHFDQSSFAKYIADIRKHENFDEVYEEIIGKNKKKTSIKDTLQKLAKSQTNSIEIKFENIRSDNNNRDSNDFISIFSLISNEMSSKLENGTNESIQSVITIWKDIKKNTLNKIEDLEKILNSHFKPTLFSKLIKDIKDHEKFDEKIKEIIGENKDKPSVDDKTKKWETSQNNVIKAKLLSIRTSNNTKDSLIFGNICKTMETHLHSKLNSNQSIQSVISILKEIQKKTFNTIDDLQAILNHQEFTKSEFSSYINEVNEHAKIDKIIKEFLNEENKDKPSLEEEIKNWANNQMQIANEKLNALNNNIKNENMNIFTDILKIMDDQLRSKTESESLQSIQSVIKTLEEIEGHNYNNMTDLENIINSHFTISLFKSNIENIKKHKNYNEFIKSLNNEIKNWAKNQKSSYNDKYKVLEAKSVKYTYEYATERKEKTRKQRYREKQNYRYIFCKELNWKTSKDIIPAGWIITYTFTKRRRQVIEYSDGRKEPGEWEVDREWDEDVISDDTTLV